MVGAGLLRYRPAALLTGGHTLVQPNRPLRSGRVVLKASAAATPSDKGDSKKGSPRTPPTPKGKKAEDLVKDDITRVGTPVEAQNQAVASKKSTTPATRSTTQTAAKKNVDEGADTVKEGVDDAAETVKDTAGSARSQTRQQASAAKDNVDEGAEALKEGIDDASKQLRQTTQDVEQGIDEGVDQVTTQIDRAEDQLQDFADRAPEEIADATQQAVDATADTLNAAQRAFERAQEPGPPAPFSGQSLTNLERNPFTNRPGPQAGAERQIEYFKRRLLYIASGLDRGNAASPNATSEVESVVYDLTSASEPVVLSWESEAGSTTTTLAQLNGTWRLIYSSSFATGNLGGRAPGGGPGISLLPAQLGQVFQVISAYTARLDNVVELYSRLPNLPQLPGLPEQEPIVTTLTLRHLFEPLGGSTSQITFEDTEVKTTGGLAGFLGKLPELRLPQLPEPLRPSRDARSSTFETLFLDNDLRVSRGRNGELRIFVKT